MLLISCWILVVAHLGIGEFLSICELGHPIAGFGFFSVRRALWTPTRSAALHRW
jgi:hypothetical protein